MNSDQLPQPRGMPRQQLISREEIRAEVLRYDDEDLVVRAWEEFAELDIDERLSEAIRRDLDEAQRQLQRMVSRQCHGRLRRFVIEHRFQAQRCRG